jgi:hypothetical protein
MNEKREEVEVMDEVGLQCQSSKRDGSGPLYDSSF